MLERIGRRVPRREHGRSEPLEVAVHVACRRADIVRGHDAPSTAALDPQDQDDAEP
jgi:hypothetical protein